MTPEPRTTIPSRSRRRLAGALAGLAAGLAAPAVPAAPAARPEPPREINSQATRMSPRISQCLIRREPALVDRWLRTPAGSSAEERLFRSAEPRFPPCFGLRHDFNGSGWLPRYDRAGMRSALVRARLHARRDDLPAVPPPPAGPLRPGPPDVPPTPEDRAALVAAELGACLARRHWDSVLAIVRAVDPAAEKSLKWGWKAGEPARRREEALVDKALSKVIPSLPACVPAGARLRINRLRLRALLEEAAYAMIDADPSAAFNGR
jgi:hypothetical protein